MGGKAADTRLGSILTVTLEGCEGCLGIGLNPLNRITQARTICTPRVRVHHVHTMYVSHAPGISWHIRAVTLPCTCHAPPYHALSRELAMHLPCTTCHAPYTRQPPHPSLTQVLPGTPAAASGKLHLGDILRSIDGHSLDGIQAADVLTRAAVHTLEVCTSTNPNPRTQAHPTPDPSPSRNPTQPYA